jgi:hypothetical protein
MISAAPFRSQIEIIDDGSVRLPARCLPLACEEVRMTRLFCFALLLRVSPTAVDERSFGTSNFVIVAIRCG